jgi:hypothetical protein
MNAASSAKPTTSTANSKSSPGFRSMHISPTLVAGTTARMIVPITWLTRPLTLSSSVSAIAVGM